MTDKLWKSTVVVTLLTMGENPPEYESLDDIAYDRVFGSASGAWDISHEELSKKDFIEECWKQHTDPQFFFMDEEDD